MIDALLITGCTQGIGRELACKFSQLGCIVYTVGRDLAALQALEAAHSNIKPIFADIATEVGRTSVVSAMSKQKSFSVIHNASIAKPESFSSMSEALLREHLETNYFAPLLITQQLLPFMTSGQRIMHITSGAANMPLSGLMPYCTSKAAMQLAIQCLNIELNPRGIYCANLGPGMVDTPMQMKFRTTDEQTLPNRQFYINALEKKQLKQPSMVAEFVSWVMLKTEDIIFSKTAWSIDEKSYQKEWPTGEMPRPRL